MATRLEEYKTGLADDAQALGRLPWIPTGWLAASVQVKAAPGLLGGIMVRAEDNGGDQVVKVWDTAVGATGATEVELCRVYCSATDELMVNVFFPLPGVEAKLGIYVELSAGDAEFELYYR